MYPSIIANANIFQSQAYSQDAVAEMRDVMEKGGMDSLATRGPPKAPAVSFKY